MEGPAEDAQPDGLKPHNPKNVNKYNIGNNRVLLNLLILLLGRNLLKPILNIGILHKLINNSIPDPKTKSNHLIMVARINGLDVPRCEEPELAGIGPGAVQVVDVCCYLCAAAECLGVFCYCL